MEPFAGGAIISLTAVAENYVDKSILIELDEDVASVWQTIIYDDANWLIHKILNVNLTQECVAEIIHNKTSGTRERAFATIIENRINRGGILAPGAGRVKNGENGRGMLSRWYPETLARRIQAISEMRNRLEFIQDDGIKIMENHLNAANIVFFTDPPYTQAGRRLYRHSQIDHHKLLSLTSQLKGESLVTYDNSREIVHIALENDLQVCWVPMKTTHHAQKLELLIGRNLEWLNPAETAPVPYVEAAPQTSSN
jgi:DNA adenine methylase